MKNKEEKKTNSKKGLFLVILIIVLAILLVLGFTLFKKPEVDLPELGDNFEKNELVQTSAYDFIINEMSKPQVWSEEDIPPYPTNDPDVDVNELARQAMVNGSGFKLVDENTATFERGYLSKLQINFSNNTAFVDPDINDEIIPFNIYCDFNENTYCFEYPDGTKQKNEIKEYIEEGVYSGEKNYSPATYIKWMMQDYSDYFEEAGVPILNQPVGTLTSYKSIKEVEEAYHKDEGLLKGPWELDNFHWDYTQDETLTWLDDYRDVLNAKVETSIGQEVLYNCEKIYHYGYSPAIAVYVNKDDSTRYYNKDVIELNQSEVVALNCTAAYCAYYVKPILDHVYGYNAVYFIEKNKLNGPNPVDCLMTEEEYLEGISVDMYGDTDCYNIIEPLNNESTMPITKIGNIEGIMPWGDVNGSAQFTNEQLRKVMEVHNKEQFMSQDYYYNFYMMYDFTVQKELGLR